jgi:hypothetical protein
LGSTKQNRPRRTPILPESGQKRKAESELATVDGAGKKKNESPGNKSTSVMNTNSKSPNAAVQTEAPNKINIDQTSNT